MTEYVWHSDALREHCEVLVEAADELWVHGASDLAWKVRRAADAVQRVDMRLAACECEPQARKITRETLDRWFGRGPRVVVQPG